MQFYELLETVLIQSTMQRQATQKGMKQFGVELPEYAVTHAKNVNRGLEVWMCTLGAGISPSKRDDVRSIWRMMNDAKGDVPEAIDGLRAVESQTSAMTGQDTSMFGSMDTADWIESCYYIPASFTKEFSLD